MLIRSEKRQANFIRSPKLSQQSGCELQQKRILSNALVQLFSSEQIHHLHHRHHHQHLHPEREEPRREGQHFTSK